MQGKNVVEPKATYARTRDGHPIVVLPEHVGAPFPESVQPRRQPHRRPARCHKKPQFDAGNQTIYFVPFDGDGVRAAAGASEKTTEYKDEKAGGDATAADGTAKKGRPKGSRNKWPMNSFHEEYEKRSFAYAFVGAAAAECKPCGRTYDGDASTHCARHHDTVCPVCGRSFKPPLTAHIRSHGTRQTVLTVRCYECYACREKFGNADAMAEHVARAHEKPSADADYAPKCPACGVRCVDRAATVGHLVDAHCPQKTFSHPAVYRCPVCRAGFKSQINVLRHACNKIKSPHCDRCDKTFPSKMRYAFHLQFHEDPPMHLHCDLCLAEFVDEYQLYDHIRFRHELHDKAVCEVCGRTFKTSVGLNIHRRYHNGSRDFSCRSCGKSFLNKSTLREHEISHMDIKPFQCRICGQYLSRASRLRSHVKTHKAAECTDQRCFICARCGFAAPGEPLLAEHRNKQHSVVSGDGDGVGTDKMETNVRLSWVVKCEFCDSTYVDAAHLNKHRDAAHARGDGVEAFICVVCSSTFSTYSRLTTHKLTHGINMESALPADNDDRDAAESSDGNALAQRRREPQPPKPSQHQHVRNRFEIPQFFSCQHCDKKCLHYTYFCLHRRLKHPPGVQAYKCDQCPSEFKTSWRLSYHKKTVHGQLSEKPPERYECTVCSRKFVKIGALNLHKTRSHIDTVGDMCKYLCHQCGKFFSNQCSLRNHVKVHENVGDGNQLNGGAKHAAFRKNRVRTKPTVATVGPVTLPYRGEPIDDRTTPVGPDDDRKYRDLEIVLPACTECVLCEENLQRPISLRNHLKYHETIGDTFLCSKCCVPFLSRVSLNGHLANHCRAVATDVRRAPIRSNIKFVDAPKQESETSALVVECSEIFGKAAAVPAVPAMTAFVTESVATASGLATSTSTSTAVTSTWFGHPPPKRELDVGPLIVDCSDMFGPIETAPAFTAVPSATAAFPTARAPTVAPTRFVDASRQEFDVHSLLVNCSEIFDAANAFPVATTVPTGVTAPTRTAVLTGVGVPSTAAAFPTSSKPEFGVHSLIVDCSEMLGTATAASADTAVSSEKAVPSTTLTLPPCTATSVHSLIVDSSETLDLAETVSTVPKVPVATAVLTATTVLAAATSRPQFLPAAAAASNAPTAQTTDTTLPANLVGPELSVIDELFAILSSPRNPTALDSNGFEQFSDLEDIFNDILNNI